MITRKQIALYLLAVALLRLAMIWQAPLWYDEAYTYLISGRPWISMLHAVVGDVHPPLYYLLVWPIGQSGLPDWTLRLPSALFSTISLWLMWRIMVRLYVPVRAQWVTLALLAVLPGQLAYAQEARMYALLEMECLLLVYALIERRTTLAWLAATAMLYTQNYAVIYLPVVWAVSVLRRPRDWKPITVAIVAAFLAWSPWSIIMRQQMQSIGGTYWLFDTSLGNVFYTVFSMLWAYAVVGAPAAVVPVMFATYAWTVVAIAWLASAIVDKWRRLDGFVAPHRLRRDIMALGVTEEYYYPLILAFAPLVLAEIASLLWNPILLFRPLIGSTPWLALALAWPLATLDTLRSRLIVATVILPMLIIGLGGYYLYTPTQKGASSADRVDALDYIRARWQPGDLIYHGTDASLVNWLPYSRGLAHIAKPACSQKGFGYLTYTTRSALGVGIAPLPGLNYRRAWLVWAHSPLTPACEVEEMQALIGDAAPVYVIEDSEFTYAAIWLLEKP